MENQHFDLLKYLSYSYNWDLNRDTSIPNLLFQHLYITGLALLVSLLIAFPIGIVVARYKRLYLPVITTAGVLYTIPSLALLAFLVSYTGLSLTTVLIALVVYTQVILIRNIVAAIRAVDPALLDVGRAMGMNERQLLWRVTLPLALPVIIAGVRVATVSTIGIATIAPLVGVQDLGYLIFQGIDPLYPEQILTGALLITLLAVLADVLLLWIQTLLNRGRSAFVVAR
jgi:osmoprotectant transport system permease protein